MTAWAPIIFFADEDAEALKLEFIQLSAKHKGNFDAYSIAQYIFRNLRDPSLRAMQAADVWAKDLEVQEAIRKAILFGEAESAKEKRVNILMQMAEDTRVVDRDRIAALRLAAEMEGEIVKAVEKKVTYPNGVKPSGLPSFTFVIDKDADKPGIDQVLEDEDA